MRGLYDCPRVQVLLPLPIRKWLVSWYVQDSSHFSLFPLGKYLPKMDGFSPKKRAFSNLDNTKYNTTFLCLPAKKTLFYIVNSYNLPNT